METPSTVQGLLHYTADNGKPLDYFFYEPERKDSLNPPGRDVRPMAIHNGWPMQERFDLDREGFALREFPYKFRDFDDEAKVKTVFYDYIKRFVKEHTGARRVEIFDNTIRRRMSTKLADQSERQRPAVLLVHSDYTERSAPQRVRDFLPDEAESLLRRRVAFYNVWKPLYTRVEELPLALCDARTTAPQDYLRMELQYADRTGEIYVVRHAPQHQWYYFPLMHEGQALLLKTYDSLDDGRARFMAHTAFEDPSSPEHPRPRESIEVRTMAFF